MSARKEDRFGPHELYLGIDVGKSFHWAMGVDSGGEVVIDRPLSNRKADIDALLEEAGCGALVVVDQKNNIGSLVVRRCRAAGIDVGYLPGKAMKRARDMFPGTAKTDRIDAEVIARPSGPLVEDELAPQQELEEPLAGSLQVVPGVLERSGEVRLLHLGYGSDDASRPSASRARQR